jgi:dipeptidyl aminopeptidase/acylaminoacyl peptidase
VKRAAFLLALVACGSAKEPRTSTTTQSAPVDGTILERAPCVLDDYETMIADEEPLIRADIEKAGLAAEYAARPLRELVTAEEHARLRDGGRCERIVYASSGLRIVGYIVRPPDDGPHPVVLWLRGGNRDFGRIHTKTLLDLQVLADRGFVVIGTQYREAEGGEGKDEFGGRDVHDVLALVPLARDLPGADADRLYVLGGSRGAMQALIAIRRGLPVRAAVFRGGMFDAVANLEARPDLEQGWAELIPDFATRRDERLAERSPVQWVGETRVPMLLLHAELDWRSDPQQARDFAAALKNADIEHRLLWYERDEHQLLFHRPAWLHAAADWFATH